MTEHLLRLFLFLPLISLWRCRYEVICASGFQMVQTSVSFMFIRAMLHIMNLLGEKWGRGLGIRHAISGKLSDACYFEPAAGPSG